MPTHEIPAPTARQTTHQRHWPANVPQGGIMAVLLPSAEAIRQAARILVSSVTEQLAIALDVGDETAQLQHQIDILESASRGIRDHLQRDAASLKRRLNAALPIHKLPTELFTNILLLEIRNHYSPEKNHSPYGRNHIKPRRRELASVCNHWLQTIPASPLLWTDIPINGKEWEMALKLSRNAPLRVQCDRRGTFAGIKSSSTMYYLQTVASSANRWQEVLISVDGTALGADVAKCFQGPTPVLQDLAIILDYTSLVLPLSGTQPLRHVHLSSAGVPWDSPRLSQLKSLELSYMTESSPTLEQLRNALSASPQLERLAVRNMSFASGGQVRLEPIDLPRLVSLQVGLVEPSVWAWIVNVINAHLYSIHFLRIDEHLFDPTNPNIHPFHRLLDHILRDRPKITLCNEVEEGSISVKPNLLEPQVRWDREPWVYSKVVPNLLMDVETEEPFHAMRAVSAFLAASGTNAQIILIAHGTVPTAEHDAPTEFTCPVDVLDVLTHVHAVDLLGLPDTILFLQHLSQVRQDEAGRSYNPCPKLRLLELSTVPGLTWEHVRGVYSRLNKIPEINLPEDLVVPADPAEGDEAGDVGGQGNVAIPEPTNHTGDTIDFSNAGF